VDMRQALASRISPHKGCMAAGEEAGSGNHQPQADVSRVLEDASGITGAAIGGEYVGTV